MNINNSRIHLFIILGSLILMGVFTSCLKVENELSEKELFNLALRQVGDRLYRYCGDDHSTIPAVEVVSNLEYKLEFENGIEYDVLPEIMEKTFKDFGILDDYIVSVLDCENETILLGYNTIAIDDGFVPCEGRDKGDTCNILKVEIYQPSQIQQSKSYIWYIIAGIFLVGFFYIRLKSKTSIKEDDDPLGVNSEDVLSNDHLFKIGNSLFDSRLLTITHHEKSTKLTFREAKLFGYFVNNKNEILKREDLQSYVWEEEGIIVGRSLDVFISRLRKILKSDDSLAIKNIHGVGYRLEEHI